MHRQNYNLAAWREWQNGHEKHVSKIKEISSSLTSRIDNHLSENLRHSRSNLTSRVHGSGLNLLEIDRKNAKILEKLTRMARSPIMLKTLPTAENKINKRKYFLKKIENNKIHQENIRFAKRLAKTHSSVNFKKYELDFVNNKKYCEIRQKHFKKEFINNCNRK